MRSLIVSILSLSLSIGVWCFFHQHSQDALLGISAICEKDVMTAIEDGKWDEAFDSFGKQYDKWHEYRSRALLFLDTDSINQTDETFARTLMYIKAEDLSNSSGELLSLKEQLRFLHENEAVTWANIL